MKNAKRLLFNARANCAAALIFTSLLMSPSALVLAAQKAANQGNQQQTTTPFTQRPSVESDVQIRISLMDPKSASDIFGKRIGKRYVVMQITIENKNKDFQFLIHDLSIDLTKIWQADGAELRPHFRGTYQMSSEDKTLVRGVAEKAKCTTVEIWS